VLQELNKKDAAIIAEVKAAKADAQRARKTLVAQKAEAEQRKDEMAANANEVKARLESRGRLLANLTAEIQTLVAKRIAQQAAAEQARTMRLLLRQRTGHRRHLPRRATSYELKAAAAVYWAEKQLGKPTSGRADGPDTFDCSGLDDVRLRQGRHQAEPLRARRSTRALTCPDRTCDRDLVFFGSPIHHVGVYGRRRLPRGAVLWLQRAHRGTIESR
jgi:cell wall-associated NlpC family hydrolase